MFLVLPKMNQLYLFVNEVQNASKLLQSALADKYPHAQQATSVVQILTLARQITTTM